ncbi:quinol monooxygenase YgiN [Stackebrandtia endophytica]|uniref:Quinol monooxygenase YgiN n=1 Tax=Stackebrandtia endophytica TaxID=1496996 RepID=A0A543AW70_9ACTN|nr:putative quinol monooxygenase [Stackebrandtia endophytica]TQL76802.1 quinol monooxygenase YgiN [Stackebrandtia endophytica]
MLIIAGSLRVAPEDRDGYVASLDNLIRTTRAKPGCLDFVIAADPVDPGRVNLLERWESEELLAAHQATADVPEPVTEILTDTVRKYSIASVGPVF